MLTPRTAIVIALALWLVSVLFSIGAALKPDDSGGRGLDSFGTLIEGQRGVYETLHQLNVPVMRQFHPPDQSLPKDVTLVLFAPDAVSLGFEPRPLREVREWVKGGGRLVFLAPDPFKGSLSQIEQLEDQLDHFDADLFRLLQLEGISIEPLTHRAVPSLEVAGHIGITSVPISTSLGLASDGEGELSGPRHLAFPTPVLSVLRLDSEADAVTHTAIVDGLNEVQTIAATVPMGAGEIVIVSDSRLLENRALGAGDNAEWGVDLLTDGGRRSVVFDEFYHGLLVRGNNWWLLTKGAYLYPFLAILLVLGLVTWRAGTLLGPTLSTQDPGRRVIGEYVEAMGAMFLKAHDGRRFVLQSVQDGQWRQLCHEFHVAPGTTEIETIAALIARRDPERANRVRASFAASRNLLTRHSISEGECLMSLQQLDRCR